MPEGQQDQNTVSMSIRVPKELHASLKHHADECGTALSTYVNWTLERFHGYLHARFIQAAKDVDVEVK